MTLLAGTRLGPYEVLSPLGAGGMGEVYKARDTRLGREVAVKVLPERLSLSPEARQRFEREARTISQLSHPHICALYDVGNQDGIEYLVMELLEGETLAERLGQGSLPLELTLRYGAEIADALDKAHRQGIVHRDLKPGNVMLTKSGVKLLDFGLAKAFAPSGPVEEWSSLPTAGAEVTREGAILGTLSYMAPEQLQAKPVDARADIFALGAVLYEMATGKRAFTGSNQASVIAAILSSEPPAVSSLAVTSPPALDRLVRLCLAKDPDERWQSAHDVRLDLEALRESPTAPPPRRSRWSLRWLPWAAALVAAAVAVWALWGRKPEGGSETVRFSVAPPAGESFPQTVETRYFALSPDGRLLAFVAAGADGLSQIYLRPFSSFDARALPGTEDARSLFWSPDGRSLAFFTRAQLKRIEVEGGGAVVPLCNVPESVGKAGSWGAAGRIVFSTVHGNAIYAASTSGGAAREILKPDPARHESRLLWPSFLPDGKRFLYISHHDDNSKTLMIYEADGKTRPIGSIASDTQCLDPGYLLYVREGTLLAQHFDPSSGSLRGDPVPVASGIDYFLSTGAAAFSAARTGALAYHAGRNRTRFVWFDRSGREVGRLGEAGDYQDMALSPDGNRLLFDRIRPEVGTYDVWLFDLDRGGEERVTSDPDTEIVGAWLPDGRRIVYSANQGLGPQLFLRDLTTGKEEPLLPGKGFQQARSVSPDGRTLAFTERSASGSGRWEASTVSLDSERRRQILCPSTFSQGEPTFSPDGRYVAFLSSDTGRWEVYVTPFPPTGEKFPVSSDGASALRWSRQSGEIFYVSADGRLVAVSVRTVPRLEIGRAVTLFQIPGRGWIAFDVTPDGRRFLANVSEVSRGELPISVVTGWKPRE